MLFLCLKQCSERIKSFPAAFKPNRGYTCNYSFTRIDELVCDYFHLLLLLECNQCLRTEIMNCKCAIDISFGNKTYRILVLLSYGFSLNICVGFIL